MAPFNDEMVTKGLPKLRMGIGINTGEVVVGNIGSEARAKYGIVGTAVNITQRIQTAAGGGRILLSEAAHAHLQGRITISDAFRTSLKGIQEHVMLYVLQGVSECGSPEERNSKSGSAV